MNGYSLHSSQSFTLLKCWKYFFLSLFPNEDKSLLNFNFEIEKNIEHLNENCLWIF